MTWHVTNQHELAFMANASADQPNVWDRLLGGGDWLRSTEMQAAGADEFARRVEASHGDVDVDYWEEAVAAASCFGVDTTSSLVTIVGAERRVHLVSAQLGGLLAQLLLSDDTMALRWGAARDGWSSIIEELREVGGCAALQAVAWDEVRGERLAAWENGTFARDDGEGAQQDIVPDFETAVHRLGEMLLPAS